MPVTCAILTVSDTCFTDKKNDQSGRNLAKLIEFHFPSYKLKFKEIVPDERSQITNVLKTWITAKCNLILTTGGTGIGTRDVTPEATFALLERELPAMQFGIVQNSLNVTPMAMLSRAVCGVAGQSLIINLPGSEKGSQECFSYVVGVIPHAIDLLLNETNKIASTHTIIQKIGKSNVQIDNVAERPRQSTFSLLEVDEAVDVIIKKALKIETETISIEVALNRVLAEHVHAPEPIPPFDASIKDGYAVLSTDKNAVRLIRNVVAAGDSPEVVALQPGEAIRISTGAPIPKGADAVVQVEDTQVTAKSDGVEISICVQKLEVKPGLDIRRKGSDIKEGEVVLTRGQVLKAFHIGVLATIGKSYVKVYKIPAIGIITTGNELQEHSESLKPGQIRDSNRITIINLLQEYHYHCKDYGIARDNPDEIKAALTKMLDSNDIIITTGGVSMGEFDYVKRVLVQDFQATIHFGRVNMKPGKPTTFATFVYNQRNKMVFSLPGNPVSASVTCLLFVIPTIRYLEGNPRWQFPILPYVIEKKSAHGDDRPEYVRVSVNYKNGEIIAERNGPQMSSRLNSLVGTNGLMLIPAGLQPRQESLSNIILFGPMNYE